MFVAVYLVFFSTQSIGIELHMDLYIKHVLLFGLKHIKQLPEG